MHSICALKYFMVKHSLFIGYLKKRVIDHLKNNIDWFLIIQVLIGFI